MWCQQRFFKLLNRTNVKNKSPQLFEFQSNSTTSVALQNVNVADEISSFAAFGELKNILNINNCQFKDGYTCFSVQCVNCVYDTGGCIYINKVTGFSVCLNCQKVGEWIDFIPQITIKKKRETDNCGTSTPSIAKKKLKKLNTIEEYNDKWNNLKQTLRPIASLSDSEIEQIIMLFGLEKICKQKMLNNLDVVYDNTRQILYFPLSNGKTRVVGIKELTMNGEENCKPTKKCPGYLRYIPPGVLKKSENVVFVHNVKDLLMLSAVKHNYHVICLPHGTHALPQEILPLLEHYTKIVLWFGADKLSTARLFAHKLNEARCYLVKAPNNPILHFENIEEQEILSILKTAHPMTNKYVVTFANMKEEVFLGVTNADQSEGIKWKRFPTLTEILRGHRRGELTILTGPTGCGKTTFLSEYSLDLAMQGVSTLWGSFEIRNQRLAATMLQQFAMEPLNENLNKFETWAREFEKLPIYFLKFHGQQSIELVMEVVEQATYVHDIRHLVIDNLQFMLGLSAAEERYIDRFYKQDKVVAAFRTFATVHDCHVTLIIHPRKEKETDDLSISSLFGTAKAAQEADNVLIIQKKMLESLRIKKYLQIVKNRFSGDLGVMPLNFTKSALSFGIKRGKVNQSTSDSKPQSNV